jgi:hypothetical protein
MSVLYIILYYIILYHIIPYHIPYIILYYIILYHIIYRILYYIISYMQHNGESQLKIKKKQIVCTTGTLSLGLLRTDKT